MPFIVFIEKDIRSTVQNLEHAVPVRGGSSSKASRILVRSKGDRRRIEHEIAHRSQGQGSIGRISGNHGDFEGDVDVLSIRGIVDEHVPCK